MLYNQPYGVSDPNASYINGNPSTGTAGSIPPAASIEHDQREIVNVIQWAFDHGYIDMDGNPCGAPSSAILDQLLKALFGIMNSTLLRAPQTYYVDGTNGSDSNDGLTTATAFATIQKALDTTVTWNQNGFGVTINVAAGVYDGTVLPALNGSGGCTIVGSGTGTCTISGVNKSAVIQNGGVYEISNFALTASGVSPPGDHVAGIQSNQGMIIIHDIKFLACVGPHLEVLTVSQVAMTGPIEIAGSALSHLQVEWGGKITSDQDPYKPVLTISAPVTFGTFALANNASMIIATYQSITGSANVTGKKYDATGNSVINTGADINYLPGTIAGTTATGGQYT
jgi:hypothetical protein